MIPRTIGTIPLDCTAVHPRR